jgi:hypothetical protein
LARLRKPLLQGEAGEAQLKVKLRRLPFLLFLVKLLLLQMPASEAAVEQRPSQRRAGGTDTSVA